MSVANSRDSSLESIKARSLRLLHLISSVSVTIMVAGVDSDMFRVAEAYPYVTVEVSPSAAFPKDTRLYLDGSGRSSDQDIAICV